MYISFKEWTRQRKVHTIGTNAGSPEIPFQKWRNFKEAFAPEIVARAIKSSKIEVKKCFDPFGGSGTTALACQFSGIYPITIEVNPFLADLTEAKLTSYDADRLAKDLGGVLAKARRSRKKASSVFAHVPESFIEPGLNGRWIFDVPVADQLAKLKSAIDEVSTETHRRLFKVILGGLLIEVSNVVVSGKGRRYRSNWISRREEDKKIFPKFANSAENIISEIDAYSRRACSGYRLLRGDSRRLASRVGSFELAVFSPPYPNSFDYTDIYNVELWMLGYIDDPLKGRQLRARTLSSHVQVARKYAAAPKSSHTLAKILKRLRQTRDELWSPHLPEMVGGYFADMSKVLAGIRSNIHPSGSVWMVVGNSRYAGVLIPTAKILGELSAELGFKVSKIEHFRVMRASAQQGGQRVLAESLIVLAPLSSKRPEKLDTLRRR